PDAVRSFASEFEAALSVPIELGAPLDELAHVARSLFDQHAYRVLVAQAIAGANRVCRVQLRAVVVANGGGDAALRVAGVALAGIGLGENENASGRRERDRGAKPRDAAADDREVRPIGHRMLSYPGEFAGPQRTPAIVRHMEPLRIDVRTPSRAYAVTL